MSGIYDPENDLLDGKWEVRPVVAGTKELGEDADILDGWPDREFSGDPTTPKLATRRVGFEPR